MPVDIRYAGLDPDVERRVCFAINGLAAHHIRASANPWDGTRCDMLITDAEDTYGRIAADIARRRDTPILAFTGKAGSSDTWAQWLRRDATVSVLTKALVGALSADPPTAQRQAASAIRDGSGFGPSVFGSRAALVRLVLDPGIRRKRVLIGFSKRKLLADPQAGRLFAASGEDIAGARALLSGIGGDIEPYAPAGVPAGTKVAVSLDAAYVQAALHRNAALPDFPLRDVWLCDWPDLGQAPRHVDALLVARTLLRGKTSMDAIAAATGIGANAVSACLWAFAASGVLQHASLGGVQPLPRGSAKRRFGQLVAKMARHFGLGALA